MESKRTIEIGARADETERTIEMAISSETPVERFFGVEILSHKRGAVDLSRLRDGRHPLLLNHDTDKQIGVIERAWLDPEDKKLRGVARFSRSALGEEIFRDVQDGIRQLISVGYEILEVEAQTKNAETGELETRTLSGEEFESAMRAKYGDAFYRVGPAACRAEGSEPPTYIVTRWRPFEVSVVPIPADVAVGVGRSGDTETAPPAQERWEEPSEKPAEPPAPENPPVRVELSRAEIPNVEDKFNLETARRDQILDLGKQYAKYVTSDDVADALRTGKSVEQFKDIIMQKMESRHHLKTAELHIGMEKRDIQRYSIARAVAAMITGDWSKAGLERAASETVAKILGRQPEGFFVPYDAFHRDFNVGTATEAGNLVATELRTDLFVDVLRNNLVLAQLGVRILTGLTSNIDIPTKATPSALGMLPEVGTASETAPTTGKVTLSPKRIGAFVDYSKQALIQSSLAIEPMLRDDLLQGAAVLIQDQALNGVGTGTHMKGIRNWSGIGAVIGGTNGAALTWDHIVDLESACANANAEPDQRSGYCINTKTRGALKKIQKGTNLPFIWDGGATPLNGYRAAVTNSLPSNLTKGTSTTVCSSLLFASDWSMSVIGLFGAPDIVVDPYSKAADGQVRITINQYADHGVRRAADFAKMDDAITG